MLIATKHPRQITNHQRTKTWFRETNVSQRSKSWVGQKVHLGFWWDLMEKPTQTFWPTQYSLLPFHNHTNEIIGPQASLGEFHILNVKVGDRKLILQAVSKGIKNSFFRQRALDFTQPFDLILLGFHVSAKYKRKQKTKILAHLNACIWDKMSTWTKN